MDNPRAIVYRRLNDIPGDWGTAVKCTGNGMETWVMIQVQVLHLQETHPQGRKLYGEFLMNAQGEDVVAGIRTPQPLDQLKDVMPDVYNQFVDIAEKLETL